MSTQGTFSVEIPDPVMVWEVEPDIYNEQRYLFRWIVRAVVGATVVFERAYFETNLWGEAPEGVVTVDDAEDARRLAAEELGAKLRALLT
jgi:hypothetical protein